MDDEFVKRMWHDLSKTCHQLGRGPRMLPRVLGKLQELLRDGERLALSRNVPVPPGPASLPAEPVIVPGVIVAVLTEAQIALAAGNLQRFINQIHLAVAMVQAMYKRKAVHA